MILIVQEQDYGWADTRFATFVTSNSTSRLLGQVVNADTIVCSIETILLSNLDSTDGALVSCVMKVSLAGVSRKSSKSWYVPPGKL